MAAVYRKRLVVVGDAWAATFICNLVLKRAGLSPTFLVSR
jgi:hypothetical protein